LRQACSRGPAGRGCGVLWFALAAILAVANAAPAVAGPPAAAVAAWDTYVAETERRIARELEQPQRFLAVQALAPAIGARTNPPLDGAGLLYAVPVATSGAAGAVDVDGGMRHHWLAAVFVPGASVAEVLAFVQDYDHQAGAFPDVLASKAVSRRGDVFEVWLRLRRTKVITVIYDTTHTVVYRSHGSGRASSRSVATRIVEVEAGAGGGYRERPADSDRGFLWRLNSYWRFMETPGGTIVECESLSLSRGIPTGLGWLVGRFVTSVPRESLEQTLFGIRDGTRARHRAK
jgi:hypothetical protein